MPHGFASLMKEGGPEPDGSKGHGILLALLVCSTKWT